MRQGFLAVGGVTGALLFALAPSALAAPAVTKTTDGGAGSLRAAVEGAAPGETISIQAGTYKLTLGQLPINKSLILAGAGEGATTLEGSGNARVLDLTGAGSEVTLQSLTVRGGHVREIGAAGAGIASEAGQLVLRGVEVADNVAEGLPAGVNPSLTAGGGVAIGAGRLTVIGSSFHGNSVNGINGGEFGASAFGGAVALLNETAASISDSTFTGNHAVAPGEVGVASGAGIAFVHNSNPGPLTNSTFSGNSAQGGEVGQGGAIFIQEPIGDFNISGITVVGNQTTSDEGGAVGGGIEAMGDDAGTVRILSSTIANNSAQQGGNLDLGFAVLLGSSVVSGGVGNEDEQNCSEQTAPENHSLGLNFESTAAQCGFDATGDIHGGDPQLGPLTDNGGPTLTMAPAASSPLIDAGASFGLTADQRGQRRPVDDPAKPNAVADGADGSDIGAVESQTVGAAPAPPAQPKPNNGKNGKNGNGNQNGQPGGGIKLSFGKLKLNAKKGTATLAVKFSRPATGTLTLAGKGLRKTSVKLKKAKSALLVVSTSGKTHRILLAKRKAKVRFTVTFSPKGGKSLSVAHKVTLKHR
jgi:hypothetical protein